MPQAKVQRRSPATKKAATRKRPASRTKRDVTSAVDRTTELSDDVFQSLEDGGKAAIEAVRKFLETVDKALPPQHEGPSRREEIVDSALEMAERLVHTQAEFLRKVTDSAGKALAKSGDAK